MSIKINITKVSGKSTPKGTTPPTAKTAVSAKTTATPKVLPPIPTLKTTKIKDQKNIDVEDITGDDGKKVFKKVKKESNVDTGPDSIDSILKSTETFVEKVSDLVSKLIKFIKKSLKITELKKVFFMIFMAIAMAILFMGLNILFGKVIL